MRLAVSKQGSYSADFYCANSYSAKKVLNEQMISIMAVDYYLNGRENGKSVLSWAIEKNVLPQFVVITEKDRTKRMALMSALVDGGYASPDGTTFIKH
ncbi:MAG: hypothetical protein K6L80_11275 [Agarilytica sp.]